jgi:hypothetical protein
MHTFRRTIVTSALAISLIMTGLARAEPSEGRMSAVIDNLVKSYNATDSMGYASYYSFEMLAEFSYADVGKDLRSGFKRFGPILSHTAAVDSEGTRARVTLTMVSTSFDVHLRLNDLGEIVRDEWVDFKPDPMVASGPSAEEQAATIDKYRSAVTQFVKSITDQDVALVMSLFAPDEEDPWAEDDYRDFLKQMKAYRGPIVSVGAIQAPRANEVLLPIHYEGMDLAVYLGFDQADLITGLKMTNYAPRESEGHTMADIGADTVRTSDLTAFLTLQHQFNADSGKTRLIALLSPT